jgi:hypothetical protein
MGALLRLGKNDDLRPLVEGVWGLSNPKDPREWVNQTNHPEYSVIRETLAITRKFFRICRFTGRNGHAGSACGPSGTTRMGGDFAAPADGLGPWVHLFTGFPRA